MVCVCECAIMHSLTLVHYRYVHMHNHGITKRQMQNCVIANTMINKTNTVYATVVTNMPLSAFVVGKNRDLPLNQCN